MEEKLSILLVEDDFTECRQLSEAIDKTDDLLLANITNNSAKAFQYICDSLPDIVILDLELIKGSGSGLALLTELSQTQLRRTPYILVTTNNVSSVTVDYVHKYGADYVLSKHQEDYSAESVVSFIKMMKSVIRNKRVSSSLQAAEAEPPLKTEKRINRRIISELNHVGVNPKSVGYDYLVEAVKIMLLNKEQNLCAKIAAKNGKSDASVERAMQNAINRAWRTNDIETLLEYYTAPISSSRGVPTITEFVCYYANLIKNDY